MAYENPSDRRIVVPPPAQIVNPRFQVFSAPPPPPPGAAYFAVGNPSFGIPGATRPVFVAPPLALRYDPAILFRMDEQRTQSLLQFMANEGLVPTPDEEMKRKDVIDQLKKIVVKWVKKVAWQRQLSKEVIANSSATILAYGSYGLGVHGSDSDIDALCVGPYFASMEEDFFIVLRNMLQSRPEVSEVQCVKSAKIPLMRFKLNGISIDFPYAQIQAVSIPDNLNLFDSSLVIANETSWRSLSGVRANVRICQLVPNLKNFQSVLRCIKFWARRRGIYSHLLGFLGGIHLAILVAYVCQGNPTASISSLISIFFESFSYWHWPNPVILQNSSMPYRQPDCRSLMPIMMPCSPFDWCKSNITRSTFSKIMAEFLRAYSVTRELGRPDFGWSCLFEPFPYTQRYSHFVRIFLGAHDGDELRDWVGWVKSRFRGLLLKLEVVQGYCDPNPNEYVDHSVAEPNVVFYWGLSSKKGSFPDIDLVKEDFMKNVNTDLDANYQGSRCELGLSIVESSQLPKSIHLDSTATKGSKACWRILDYSPYGQPIYSQFIPHYFVGYATMGKEVQSPVS